MDHIMITETELLGALAEVKPCPDCVGGRGAHIEIATGDIFGVQVHTPPCKGGQS